MGAFYNFQITTEAFHYYPVCRMWFRKEVFCDFKKGIF